jgi:hypothetical protein
MFEHLAQFPKVLVVGPQRSGTRIAAKCIAHDTGHRYADEKELGGGDDVMKATALLCNDEKVVLQAPGLTHCCDTWRDSVCVVMVRREMSDIVRSQERINWHCEEKELAKYGMAFEPFLPGTAAQAKYQAWDDYQRRYIAHWTEIQYEDLRAHPLWVDNREGWAWDMTE